MQTERGGRFHRNQAQIAQCSQWDVSVELQQKAGESLGFVETIARFLPLAPLQDINMQPVCKCCRARASAIRGEKHLQDFAIILEGDERKEKELNLNLG